jgi:hypothetical protein
MAALKKKQSKPKARTGKPKARNGKPLVRLPDETTTTRWQERVSALVFREVINVRSKVYTYDEIVNGKGSAGKSIQRKIFKEFPEKYMANDEWLINFWKQQDKFFNVAVAGTKINTHTYQEFDRDDPKGFMGWIEKNIKQYGISKKDTWNPADIWLVKNSKKVREDLEVAMVSENIDHLNSAMKQMLRERRLVGVSLKKISGKQAKWQIVNLEKTFNFIGKGPPKYELGKTNLALNIVTDKYFETSPASGKAEKTEWKKKLARLAKKHKDKFDDGVARSFQTLEMNIMVTEKGEDWIQLIIKSSSTSSSVGQNLKFEPVDQNAKGARLGRAETDAVAALFAKLGNSDGNSFNNWRKYPRTLGAWMREKTKYQQMAQNVLTKTKNWNCETGIANGQEFGENVTWLFQEVEALSGLEPSYKRNTGYEFGPGIGEATDWGKSYRDAKYTSDRLRFNIVSKLMILKCADMLKKLSTKKFTKNKEVNLLEVWLTEICFMAQKRGKGFGPFGKIY